MVKGQKPKHAVLVYFKLANDEYGTESERVYLNELEVVLEAAYKDKPVGEFDGYETGDGWSTLYFYGPDADELYADVLLAIKKHPHRRGSYVVKRYGPPGSKQEKLDLER